MTTLSQLVRTLNSLRGSGHPAVFQTPNGKRFEVERITNTSTFPKGEPEKENVETIVHLKEIKDGPSNA